MMNELSILILGSSFCCSSRGLVYHGLTRPCLLGLPSSLVVGCGHLFLLLLDSSLLDKAIKAVVMGSSAQSKD